MLLNLRNLEFVVARVSLELYPTGGLAKLKFTGLAHLPESSDMKHYLRSAFPPKLNDSNKHQA